MVETMGDAVHRGWIWKALAHWPSRRDGIVCHGCLCACLCVCGVFQHLCACWDLPPGIYSYVLHLRSPAQSRGRRRLVITPTPVECRRGILRRRAAQTVTRSGRCQISRRVLTRCPLFRHQEQEANTYICTVRDQDTAELDTVHWGGG